MYRVYCNGCFTFYNKDKSFSLTSCGHVYCLQCLPHGNRENCKICNRKFSRMPINKQMPEPTLMLFKDVKRTVLSFSKIVRFQSEQNDRFTQHLLKENQRLKRLVICYKKRVEFLSKKSTTNVTSQMYKTIKQEPIDEDYINAEFGMNGQIDAGLNGNVSIKNDQFGNIDWESEMSTEEYDQATRQYVNTKNFVPQMKPYPGQDDSALASEIRKMGINVSLNNLAQFNKRLNLAQERSNEDSKPWNFPPTVYFNPVSGAEKHPKPQLKRQSTMDRFLCRGNNFINSVPSNHFSLNNQSMGPIGSGNYPNTVLATRHIDADTIKRQFSDLS